MDDKLPNQNNNPPPNFGSNFDPHSNPQDPNNPYQTYQPTLPQATISEPPNTPTSPNIPNHPNSSETDLKDPAQSEVAKHQARGPDGKFIPSEHRVDPSSQITSTTPNTSNPPDIPKPEGNFKKTIKFIAKIKWAKVTLYIVSFIGLVGLIISQPAVKNLIEKYFPNSSPIIAREVSLQGVLKSSQSGLYTLVLPDQQAYTLHFKPSVSLTNLKKVNEVMVKGHLSWKPFVIEEAELYPLNFTTDNSEPSSKSQTSPNSPNTPNPSDSPNPSVLPPLYSALTWEVTQTKTLIFTSGKRKIEQQGVYLESSQVDSYPQAFIDYYTNQLTNLGFKQTLDSKEPSGTTTTYAKEDTYLTFGVKNVFKGSGDTKQIIGYKAYIEHN